MNRKLFVFITAVSLLLIAPATASGAQFYAAGVLELMDTEVTVAYNQGVLYVNGGEGLTLEVVSLTGKKVVEEQIESPAQKFELNIPKGCYIVKVGNIVRKISVR